MGRKVPLCEDVLRLLEDQLVHAHVALLNGLLEDLGDRPAAGERAGSVWRELRIMPERGWNFIISCLFAHLRKLAM